MKHVLITGASGFIGKALVDYLHQNSIGITLVTKSSPIDMSTRFPFATIIYQAMDDYPSLREKLQNQTFDCIYHLAWEGSTGSLRQDEALQKRNMESTLILYQLACDLLVKRFIALGTVSENLIDDQSSLLSRHPHLWYAWAKRKTYLRLTALSRYQQTELLWVQLPNVYGLDNTSGNLISYTLQTLHDKKELSFTHAEQPYDLIHVSDVVRALYTLGFFPKFKENHYYIGSGFPRKLKDYLTYIITTYGYRGDMGFGKRSEDHLVFHLKWFDTTSFSEETGFQVSKTFEEHMSSLIDIMKG